MESQRETRVGSWSAPQCPFTIEYSPRVLDEIRLAVVDAFFSLPRGGAEIGGLLLGEWDDGRLTISGHVPVECEHASGPSFTLSGRDHDRLAALLESLRHSSTERQPVGWYHSHTRSELFLSEADREIHQRYFPEPWQVALVLRPHTFRPMRGGFFFREPDGSIRCESSHCEFELAALPMAPAPVAAQAAAADAPAPAVSGPALREAPVADGPAQFRASAAEAPAEPESEPINPPDFLYRQPPASHRGIWALLMVAVTVAVGAAGFETRGIWAPRLAAVIRPETAAIATPMGLNAIDLSGQLQIRWNGESPAVRRSIAALLLIMDGTETETVALDSLHLATGSFTYQRQTGRVDVTLIIRQPDGREVREATTFLQGGRAIEESSAGTK